MVAFQSSIIALCDLARDVRIDYGNQNIIIKIDKQTIRALFSIFDVVAMTILSGVNTKSVNIFSR